MNLKYFFIFIYALQLFMQYNFGNILEERPKLSNHDKQGARIAINTIKNCLKSKNSRNILIGDLKNEYFVFYQKFPLITISHSIKLYKNVSEKSFIFGKNFRTYKVNNQPVDTYSANNFIILTTSNSTLPSSLNILQQSQWWNHEGFYLIIEQNYENHCKAARKSLEMIWSFNILLAVYLCYNADNKFELYTFNPYNNYAPKFWNLVDTYVINDHPWTLFQHSIKSPVTDYSSDIILENLKFDKTQNLNGHIIKMAAYVHSNLLIYDSRKKGLERFGGVNADITLTICKHLNASASFKFYESMGSVDDEGFVHGFLVDLHFGELDIAMNMNIMRMLWKKQTYPHEMSGFCIVSLKHPVTFLQKFKLVITNKIWLILGSVLLIIIFVFKFVLRQSLLSSVIKCLQILLSTLVLPRTPTNSIRRLMYLLTIVLAGMTSCLIQTRLSSIHIAPDISPAIDSLDNLLSTNLSVLGTLRRNELFHDPDLLVDRYRLSEYPKCLSRLKAGEPLVCIAGCIEAQFNVSEGEMLHVSRQQLVSSHFVFSVRRDWPLLRKFNRVLRLMVEAGLVKLFRERESRYFKKPNNAEEFKTLSMENLGFCFVAWSIGLILAFVAFFNELVVFALRNNFVKPNLQWLRFIEVNYFNTL